MFISVLGTLGNFERNTIKTESITRFLRLKNHIIMSTGTELLTIYNRIGDRVEKGSNNYSSIARIIQLRADTEEKIAQQLLALIPPQFDATDPLTSALIDEIKEEAQQHQNFARDLKSKVINQCNSFKSTMTEKQKSLMNIIRRETGNVQRSLSDVERAQKEIESQKIRCQGLDGAKLSAQQLKVTKAQQDYQRKMQAANNLAMQSSSSTVPSIHRDFSAFDSNRLIKLKASMEKYGKLKKSMNDSIRTASLVLIGKLNNFDGKDRSDRYIAKVFDTAAKEVIEDDPEMVAVAIADYRSDEPKDLQFLRGDKIHVLVQHGSGWWEGELNGNKGIFPRSFVQIAGDVDPKNDQIGAVFLVKKDYQKTRGGDITLLAGDLVYVDYVSKGRCSGTNLRDKKRGYFPLDVLESRL